MGLMELTMPELLHRREVSVLLLAAETLGVGIILADGVPLYKQVIRDVGDHTAQPGVVWWAVAAVVLVQVSYWLRQRFPITEPLSGHPVTAHVLLFFGRLAFVFVTSVFSFVFLLHYSELDLPPHRSVMLILLLFSMFCWNLDLERFAKGLMERAPAS